MAKDTEKSADETPKKKRGGSGQVAKKSHVLHQNEYHFDIKEGEPLPDGIPDHLLVALKTEGVID